MGDDYQNASISWPNLNVTSSLNNHPSTNKAASEVWTHYLNVMSIVISLGLLGSFAFLDRVWTKVMNHVHYYHFFSTMNNGRNLAWLLLLSAIGIELGCKMWLVLLLLLQRSPYFHDASSTYMNTPWCR